MGIMMGDMQMQVECEQVVVWFRMLCDRIVVVFEVLEDDGFCDLFVGWFEVKLIQCGEDGGGGLMLVMCGGCVFEKVGVNWFVVYGMLGLVVQQVMVVWGVLGIGDDLWFWVLGISLVVYMCNFYVLVVYMNIRMFWMFGVWWFGGGIDLNFCFELFEDM